MHDELLYERRITLRLSIPVDRRIILDRLAHSDITSSMFGEPIFPEQPAPTWEELCEDYTPHFFESDYFDSLQMVKTIAEGET